MERDPNTGRFDKFLNTNESEGMDKSKSLEELKVKKHFHWMHWIILVLSLVITLGAWKLALNQSEQRVQAKFNLEAKRIVELTLNRLQRYEDGLLGGIAAIKSHTFGMEHLEWRRFADTLHIERSYPGINGIGIIFNIQKEEMPSFLKEQNKTRKDFKVYPKHNEHEYWPITYIEPESTNLKAVGLDMAHESNRYNAIKKARDTGEPKITGPITLVQDSEKTPGFLFYIPYYVKDNLKTAEERRKSFQAVVYAPFIVKNLMKGVLREEDRHVNFKIIDDGEVLYDEIAKLKRDNYISKFSTTKTLDIYGRKWKLEIIDNPTFQVATKNSQPTFILIAGIIIDIMILFFFIFLQKTNEKAILIANKLINKEEKRRERAQSFSKMATLGEMASGIAHEINNPVAIICGYAGQINMLSSMDKFDKDKFIEISKKIDNTGKRISKIIKGLKSYSRDASLDPMQRVTLESIIDDTLSLCEEKFRQNSIRLERPLDISDIYISCRPVEISQVLLNLLNNAFDAIEKLDDKWIKISVEKEPGYLYLKVKDSGKAPINIAEKIFNPFYTTKDIGKGTGLGLSICYGIIEKHGGLLSLDIESETTTFVVKLPLKTRSEDLRNE